MYSWWWNYRRGEVKYVGKCKELVHGFFIGIALDEPLGDNNGCIKGVKYFEAHDNYGINYGIMVRPSENIHLLIHLMKMKMKSKII